MESTKQYLSQFAPTKRLICFLTETLNNCVSENERKQIERLIADKEQLLSDIYSLVFQLPNTIGLEIISLRYLEDKSVDEVCSVLYIAKSTYHNHHNIALQILTEKRCNR